MHLVLYVPSIRVSGLNSAKLLWSQDIRLVHLYNDYKQAGVGLHKGPQLV